MTRLCKGVRSPIATRSPVSICKCVLAELLAVSNVAAVVVVVQILISMGLWKEDAQKEQRMHGEYTGARNGECVPKQIQKRNVNESNGGLMAAVAAALVRWYSIYDKRSWHIHRHNRRTRNLYLCRFEFWRIAATVATHLRGKPIWLPRPVPERWALDGCVQRLPPHDGNMKKKKMREIHLFPALSICLSRGKKLNGTHGIMSLVKYCFVVDDFTTFCLIDINGPVCSVHHCVGWIRTEITQLKGLTSLHPSFGAFAWRLGIADHRAPNCPICPFNRRVESEVELGKCFLAAASIFTVFYDENRCVCW